MNINLKNNRYDTDKIYLTILFKSLRTYSS